MTVVENAEITDIDQLVELRLAYLNEDYGDLSENVRKKIRQDLPDYFKRNLNQNIFGYLIKEKDKIIACAFLLVVEKPVSATEDGYHLYKSVGFTDERLKYHSMKWYNQSCKRVLE